jgi:hypothetical protein
LRLALCLPPGDVTVTDPTAPFPDNYGGTFPDEAFYWTGDTSVTTAGGGSGLLVLALEAAFLNGPVVAGDQVVFGRIRFRIDNLIAGETYTITTPFDVFTEVAEAAGTRGINVTEDIGLVQGDFTVVLGARVGPFLTWDTGLPVLDAEGIEYVGDPAIPHTVTGTVIENPHAFGTVLTCSGSTTLPDNLTVTCPEFAVGDVTMRSSAVCVATQTVVITRPNVSGP